MNWLVLVTSFMCYNLDLVQKLTNLNLISLGYLPYLPYLFLKQTLTLAPNKQIFFEGAFSLITTSITSHLDR